jgi:hypothetical protein
VAAVDQAGQHVGLAVDADRSRHSSVTRVHAVYDWHHPLSALLGVVLMEFRDFAMQRRMPRGIKARTEAIVPRAGSSDVRPAVRARPGPQQTRNPLTGLDVPVAPNGDSCWASSRRRRRYRILCHRGP